MNLPIILASCLSLAAVFVSIGALVVARSGSGVRLLKQFTLLSEAQSDLAQSFAASSITVRNLKAQITMQTARAKAKDDPPHGDETDEELKARTRRELGAQLMRGELSALKPG